MATGLEMYGALREATQGLAPGTEFRINAIDARDLCKLRPSDLISQGYDEKIAEEISSALLNGDFGPLGTSRGLRLSVVRVQPGLLPPGNT